MSRLKYIFVCVISCLSAFVIVSSNVNVVQAAQSDVIATTQFSQSPLISVSRTELTTDKYGFVYLAGEFFGTGSLTFGNKTLLEDDLTTAADNLSASHIFIVKYTASGFPLWATKLHTDAQAGRVNLGGIAVSNNGRVYVTGTTSARIKFGFATFSPSGCTAGFISYLDSDDGQPDGGRLINSGVAGAGCNAGTTLRDVVVDAKENVYVTGDISSNASFTRSGAPITFANPGGFDAFVAKLSPSLDTDWVATRTSSGDSFGKGVGVDAKGNVYFAGDYTLTPDFAGISMGLDGCSDGDECRAGFIAKYNSDGVAQWVTSNGGTSSNIFANDFAVDSNGNSFITGETHSILNPDGGAGAFGSHRYSGIPSFVAKYDANGVAQWAKFANYYSATDTQREAVFTGVETDRYGNVFVALRYGVAGQLGNLELRASPGRNIFLLKLDGKGKTMWSRDVAVNDGLDPFQGLFEGNIAVYRDQLILASSLSGANAAVNLGRQSVGNNSGNFFVARFEANQTIQVSSRNKRAVVSWSGLAAGSDVAAAKFRVKVVGTKQRCVVDITKTRCRFRNLNAGAKHIFTLDLLDSAGKVISSDKTPRVLIGVKQKTLTVEQNRAYAIDELIQLASKGKVRMRVESGDCVVANRMLTATGSFATECRVKFTVRKDRQWPKMITSFDFFII